MGCQFSGIPSSDPLIEILPGFTRYKPLVYFLNIARYVSTFVLSI